MVRVRVSRVARVPSSASHDRRGVTIEPLGTSGEEQVSHTDATQPLTMDLAHSPPHAKRVRAKVIDLIREGDVGGVAMRGTSAAVHVLRIDPFGRIASTVDVADSMSLACYLADGSCIEQSPSNWQRAA